MYNTNELLDKVKAEYSLPSDYALAKKLGVSRGTISNQRKGINFLGMENAYKVAELLYLKPMKVIASCEFERAKRLDNLEMMNFWEDAFKD